MKRPLCNAAFLAILLLPACASTEQDEHSSAVTAAVEPSSSLVGSYSFCSGDTPKDIAIHFTVSQDEGECRVELIGGQVDGGGAAPDGGGVGHMSADGVLHFTFEDSFFNRGTGTFRCGLDGYLLSIDVDKVSESHPLKFYGQHTLHRVEAKGSKP